MATTTTFDTLQEDLKRYLERGSATTDAVVFEQLPRLINLAERRCARELKVQGFINVVTDNFVVGQSVYAKPDRWRSTVSINFGSGATASIRKPIFARDYEYLRAYWPDESLVSEPKFYADYNYSNWLVIPPPDGGYPFEVVYYELPVLLDASNQSNWLTEYAPELLLYASLLEAAPFLKNDDRIQTWQGLYDRAAAMLNGEDLSKILDRAAVRKSA